MPLPPGIGWPLASNIIRRRAENHTYGPVRHNADGSPRVHQGWDFEAADGTPCFAVADGVVAVVREGGDYGKQVAIRFAHDLDGNGRPDTLFAFYAHLSRIDVLPGQAVTVGQQIGLTGSTGNAAGMRWPDQHLHFELRLRALPGRGLADRRSPLALFGHCPLRQRVLA
jgi:peptidoglycan LD-endopeptidase LytH